MVRVLIILGKWGSKYQGEFIAGAIAFLAPFLITWAINGFWDVVTLASLIGLALTLTILVCGHPRIFEFLLIEWRKSKFKYPVKIGILSGYLTANETGGTPNRPFTDYTPQEWYNAFFNNQKKEYETSWVNTSEISNKFDIIINPFGEEYPEIDKPNRTTLKQISKFIDDGGIFVNVAGLAFYYLWDGKLEDISGPPLETYSLNENTNILDRIVLLKASHLLDSYLFTHFGIRTTLFAPTVIAVSSIEDKYFQGLDAIGGISEVEEFRSAYRCEKENVVLKPLLKADYTLTNPSGEPKVINFGCYPIAAAKFGKGYLMINGIKLEKTRPADFAKEVEAIKRIAKKLDEKGYI